MATCAPCRCSCQEAPDGIRKDGCTDHSHERRKITRSVITTDPGGIGHSAPMHRGGHVQNRIRCRQALRGKIRPGPEAEQPRMDGGPGRQAKACQHRRGRGLAGAHRRRHTKQERCDKIQTLQLHVPRGHTAQGSCRVEQERVTRTVSHSRGVRRRARDRCHRRDGALGFNQTFARDDREGCRLIPCLQEHSPLVVPEA